MKKTIRFFSNQLSRAEHFIKTTLWQVNPGQTGLLRVFLVRQLRLIYLTLQGIRRNKIVILAPALTYFSLLSLVPAAAIALGVARGLGLEKYLVEQMQISLAGREEILDWILEVTATFFSQIDSGLFALTGLGVLIYTLTMLLAALETIFNQIWQVSIGRNWLQRFRDYFAIIFLGPLLLIAAGAVTVFLTNRIPLLDSSLFNPLLILLIRLASYLIVWILFTLLYLVMPNKRVQLYPAMVAGIIAGTVFQLIQWAYINFQIGAASLGTIYGSFAALPLLMIWMQVSWVVVLLGAELSHAAQTYQLHLQEHDENHV